MNGKGIDYFPGKLALEVEVKYWLETTDGVGYTPHSLTMRAAGDMLRKIKANPEIGTVFRVVREVRTRLVEACPWCGARPQALEWDCDGPYRTATCESPQCGGVGGSNL
ncbi:hypothetical protein [Streptomyces katsurahamanus]|uniref:Uncharacterized protein n=1 Tax=Streptomyces katsurahamanus TaxID=2577098 RepID=A0ABW9P3A7_9ACTN|nr:hypothetical protein [Streptomyces katsurahamanus]MQS40012.1 hypothetical protein [Streptomyces katsurahamanus]